MTMSLAQQGSGFPFFGSSTFGYLCSKDITSIDVVVEETPDHETRNLIKKVNIAATIIVAFIAW